MSIVFTRLLGEDAPEQFATDIVRSVSTSGSAL